MSHDLTKQHPAAQQIATLAYRFLQSADIDAKPVTFTETAQALFDSLWDAGLRRSVWPSVEVWGDYSIVPNTTPSVIIAGDPEPPFTRP